MAVTITRPYLSGIPEHDERLFGCSAPNYIQWTGNGGTITTGEITDGVNTFTGLYPNGAGVFSFDLSIFGRQKICNIQGDIRPVADVAFTDETLSDSVQVTVKVNYSNSTNETATDSLLYYINGYRQRKNVKKASFYEEGVTEVTTATTYENSRVMLPTDIAPVFNGYPNDVSIFHFEFTLPTDDFLLLRLNEGTLIGDPFTIPEDYQGVIGVSLNDFTSYDSINIQTSESGGETKLNRPLTLKHYDICGTYLRWLNSYGGWSYWLFESKPVDASATDRGGIVQSFTADPFIEEIFRELPKTKEQRVSVGTRLDEAWKIVHLDDLELSNHVYVYTKAKGTVEEGTDESAWQRVKIRAYDLSPKRHSFVKTLRVEFSYLDSYTQQI